MPSADDTLFSPSKLKAPTKPALDFTADLLGEVDQLTAGSVAPIEEGNRRSSFRLKTAQTMKSTSNIPSYKASNIPVKASSMKTAAPVSTANGVPRPNVKHVNAASNLVATSTLKIGGRSSSSVTANTNRAAPANLNNGIAKRKRPTWDTKVCAKHYICVYAYVLTLLM